MNQSPSRGQISNNSKKIKKSASSLTMKKEKDLKDKKYKTFNNTQKDHILTDLRRGVIQALDLHMDADSLFNQFFVNQIEKIPLDQYNNILKNILNKHVEDFKDEVKVLTQWRKKVKSWALNTGKPETRGGLVVSVDRTEQFRERVITILRNLPFRCFKTLKDRLLVVLEEFHNADLANSKPFNNKTCSKHWWFNFINKNPDIKEMWESILLERSVLKLQGSKNRSGSGSPSEDEQTLASPTEERLTATESLGSESTALGSQGSSPVREDDQTNFGGLHYGMEEEQLPELQPLMRFNSNFVGNEMSLFFDVDQYLNINETNQIEETNQDQENERGLLFSFMSSF